MITHDQIPQWGLHSPAEGSSLNDSPFVFPIDGDDPYSRAIYGLSVVGRDLSDSFHISNAIELKPVVERVIGSGSRRLGIFVIVSSSTMTGSTASIHEYKGSKLPAVTRSYTQPNVPDLDAPESVVSNRVLLKVSALEKENKNLAACKLVASAAENMIASREYLYLNYLINEIRARDCDIAIKLTLLRQTFKFKSRLPAWHLLLDDSWKFAKDSGHRPEVLFYGLRRH